MAEVVKRGAPPSWSLSPPANCRGVPGISRGSAWRANRQLGPPSRFVQSSATLVQWRERPFGVACDSPRASAHRRETEACQISAGALPDLQSLLENVELCSTFPSRDLVDRS